MESIISHELAHHWFGNTVTCRNLSHLWLNESLASYMMMLWDEKSLGEEQLRFDVHFARERYLDYFGTFHIIRPLEYHYFDDPNSIYNVEHTYLKGAAVFHMLRRILGDEDFFRALGYYLRKHEFTNVQSEDLKIAIEESTGRNLEWFFADWVTGGGHPIFEIDYRYRQDKKLLVVQVQQVQPIVEGQDLFTLPVRITIDTPSKTKEEEVWVREGSETFFFACEDEPLLVSFDGEGDLVAEVRFPKGIDELVYQAAKDGVAGRIRAIRAFARRYPTSQKTLSAFSDILSSNAFWAFKAETALQLGFIRVSGAEELIARAVRNEDYRIRKAAVIAHTELNPSVAEENLKLIVKNDESDDVVATALVALAKVSPETALSFFEEQLSRSSWHDEIIIACLQAFEILGKPELATKIRAYVADSYNGDVRSAALAAREACAPEDEVLHRTIVALVESPVYAIQHQAVAMAGSLLVSEASGPLELLAQRNIDSNLTVAARAALSEIRRVEEWSHSRK